MGASGHKVDRNNNYGITTKQNEDKNFVTFFQKIFYPHFFIHMATHSSLKIEHSLFCVTGTFQCFCFFWCPWARIKFWLNPVTKFVLRSVFLSNSFSLPLLISVLVLFLTGGRHQSHWLSRCCFSLSFPPGMHVVWVYHTAPPCYRTGWRWTWPGYSSFHLPC